MNSTDTTAAEARLNLRIATASPGPYFFNPDLAAVALSLVRALRAEHESRKFTQNGECGGEFCTSCKAFVDWGTMLGEIASGRNA